MDSLFRSIIDASIVTLIIVVRFVRKKWHWWPENTVVYRLNLACQNALKLTYSNLEFQNFPGYPHSRCAVREDLSTGPPSHRKPVMPLTGQLNITYFLVSGIFWWKNVTDTIDNFDYQFVVIMQFLCKRIVKFSFKWFLLLQLQNSLHQFLDCVINCVSCMLLCYYLKTVIA